MNLLTHLPNLIICIIDFMTTSASFASRGSMPALLKYKIIFLGDQAVGKSSILNRYIYDIYDDKDHVH